MQPRNLPDKLGPYTLFPFQQQGVQFLAKHNFALLHDEPGVGKTLQAVAWAWDAETCLVVCPKTTIPQWEALLTVVGKSPVPFPRQLQHGQWAVTNYERLGKVSVPLGFTLIVDECHYAKNLKAKRTKQVHLLGGRASHILALSGTPMVNRPSELWSLFLLLRKRQRWEFWPFVTKYCAAFQTLYGWDFSGASNIGELKQELDSFAIRRTLAEVHKQLPPKRVETISIKLDQAAKQLIFAGEREVGKYIDAHALVSIEGLGALQRLRVAAAKAKVQFATDWIQNHLASGGSSVAVFSTFKEPLYDIARATGGVLFTGDSSESERAGSIERIQQGTSKVICLTYGAGGVGLDGLQYGVSTVLTVDSPWTPMEREQAEARVYRMGQQCPVHVVRLVLDTWIDKRVEEAIDNKEDVLNALQGNL